MAKIINVEKSKYLNQNIEIYTSNKVGQYSKFLDKNPLFVTWLHINSAESRSDVGTGGVNADVGKNSPIRFNQINNLPVYNIPELKPNTDYGENGYDIEIDISDAALLPNTIKPATGDYLIITIPNSVELAFRVNSFEYNTIQSNDFYTFSADLKYTGDHLIDRFISQIAQEYETIFENIGTDDKCFILTKDVEKIQNIGKLFLELRDSYYHNFFDPETGTFCCSNNPLCVPYHPDEPFPEEYWLYDKFIEKFIMESKIYYTENDEKSIILTNADLDNQDVERKYIQTIHYAVMNRTIDYLAPYPYAYQTDIQKRFSPFKLYDINCKGINLILTRNELDKAHSDAIYSGMAYEYFSHSLIHKLLGIDEEDDAKELTYLEEIIYNFLQNQNPEIDRKKLLQYALRVDNYTYLMMPVVIYIIMKYYDSYFVKEEL